MKLLIAYDGSEHSDAALAALQHAGLPTDAHALVLCVSESSEKKHDELLHAQHRADSASQRLTHSFPGWTVRAEAHHGSARHIIVEKARHWQADLIVMGSRGHSPMNILGIGSVSQYVLHHSEHSIRIGRRSPNPAGGVLRLLIGIGGAQPSKAAVKAVAQRHWPRGTEARIVGAIDPMLSQAGGTPELEDNHIREVIGTAVKEAAAELRHAGLTVSTAMRDSLPFELILSQAEEFTADCIFVGSRNLGTVSRALIGSTSSMVSTSANCSVEIVHR